MDIIDVESSVSHRVGHLGPLLLVVARSHATSEGLDLVSAGQRRVIAEYGYFAMVLFSLNAPRAPGPEALDRLRRSEEEIKGKSRGMVMAVLSRGLAASVARTFMTAASLMTMSKVHVVKSVEEATDRVRALTLPPEITGDAQLAQKFEAFIAA